MKKSLIASYLSYLSYITLINSNSIIVISTLELRTTRQPLYIHLSQVLTQLNYRAKCHVFLL